MSGVPEKGAALVNDSTISWLLMTSKLPSVVAEALPAGSGSPMATERRSGSPSTSTDTWGENRPNKCAVTRCPPELADTRLH